LPKIDGGAATSYLDSVSS